MFGSISLPASTSASTVVLSNDWAMTTLRAASYLMSPICDVREGYYSFRYTAENINEMIYLFFKTLLCVPAALIGSPIGLLLREIVVLCVPKSYIHQKTETVGKVFNHSLKVLSWNVCWMPGGYAQTDGGLHPHLAHNHERMMKVIEKIKDPSLKPDLICLYEIPDADDAYELSNQLKADYPFFIPVIGINAVGPSSMMYVASKYEIDENSIHFTPFTGAELTGRASFSKKGFLSFDLKDHCSKEPFVHIVTTHFQHSEIPSQAEKFEIESRKLETEKVVLAIKDKKLPVVWVGDLNQEEAELGQALCDIIQKAGKDLTFQRDSHVAGIPTWGGEEWSARMVGKKESPPLVLDYAYVIQNKEQQQQQKITIETEIHDVGFKREVISKDSLSDHSILLSTITFDRFSENNPSISSTSVKSGSNSTSPSSRL